MVDEGTRTAAQLQQQLGSLFGAKDIISWDLYDEDDREYLVRKIELLIPDIDNSIENAQRENTRLGKLRSTLVAALWNQRKFYGGKLLMSIQYVIYTKEIENVEEAVKEIEYFVYPLFRVRKCCHDENSTNCCMIFVDDNGRVYQNWADYKSNNTLPKGILVAPRNGFYNFDEKDRILLECFPTPASHLLSRVGNAANKTAGIVGVGAAAVALTALAFPVAAPVLAVAAVAGIGSGIWGAGAAAKRLIDRGTHEEPIHLKDSKARSDWIGVAGAVTALGASGATAVLSHHTALGQTASEILMGTVNSLNIATIAINGVGVGNGVFEIILKRLNKETITPLDVAQLGSSLFLLTHSVHNFETVTRIIIALEDRSIENTREELSKRQREQLDHAHKNIVNLLGSDNQGRMDVIRALNSMPDSKHLDQPIVLDKKERIQLVVREMDILGEKAISAASDKGLLEDTIDNVTVHVADPQALDKLCRIARDYFIERGQEISRQLSRFIPLEEVLWVTYKIVYKLCEGQGINDFLSSVNETFVTRKIESYYNKLIPNLGESKKCKDCGGFYTLRPIEKNDQGGSD